MQYPVRRRAEAKIKSHKPKTLEELKAVIAEKRKCLGLPSSQSVSACSSRPASPKALWDGTSPQKKPATSPAVVLEKKESSVSPWRAKEASTAATTTAATTTRSV